MTQRKSSPHPTSDATSLDETLKASTGFLLARVGMESRRLWSRMLAGRELSPAHYGALMALDQLGAASQQRLSKIVGVDPRNAVAIFDFLTARGLVERMADPHDRRRHAVTLTKSGKALIRELRRAGTAVERKMLEDLTKAERARLHQVLSKLFVGLTNADDAG